MENASAVGDLQTLGFRGVPVVASGNHGVHGVDLAQVAALVGLSYDAKPELSAIELQTRYARILATFCRLAAQVPAGTLAKNVLNRNRTCLELMNHLVAVAAGFLRVADGADFTGANAAAVPAVNLDVDPLIRHASALAQQLTSIQSPFDTPVETFYGPQTLHAVLERCTWHTAQHVRQLTMMLELEGIVPNRPLTPDDLEGLPVPTDVWDS